MNPIAISFWKVSITWYSLFILFGVFIAGILFIRECKKYKINEEFANNLIFWVVILGIIGARAYYIVFNLPYYTANPGEIFKIWNGGLAIHGGILVGLLFVGLYSLKYKIRFLKVTDMAVVGLIIAQAIGRWGNFFNGEAHGPTVARTVLEGMKIIPDFIINGMKVNDIYYHPTFYYESLWCILGFILLLCVRKFCKYIKAGQLTGIYLLWYSVGRYFIEALRTDSLMFNNIKVAQLVSIILFIVGLILLLIGLKGSKFENRYDDYELEDIKF